MTAVYREIIDTPDAWVNAPKESFLRTLSAEEVDVIAGLVDASRHLEPLEITRADFDHPVVRALAVETRKKLRSGEGAIVLSGMPEERFSAEDYKRLYWGFGTHLGSPVIQNYHRDLLTHVEEETNKDNPYDTRLKGRGYRTSTAAGYHTDTNEIVGLMCAQRAESGGESVISSALAIHNDFVRHRPDLLDSLYEGYWQAIGQDEVMTEEKAPVFGYLDGHVCVYVQFRAMRLAAEKRGEEIPPVLAEAMDYFMERAVANEAEFLLEPGEMLLWNNRTILHGRRRFENSPERRRLLYRLWLEPEDKLRIPDNFAEHLKQRIRAVDAEMLAH
ncbi:MAG TPA: TauD/TfdA family dioxygenase [Allosphingosinicella sp.]|nr:TauD/TfdA family dioxygenase [Allosphingosinicella sp.]